MKSSRVPRRAGHSRSRILTTISSTARASCTFVVYPVPVPLGHSVKPSRKWYVLACFPTRETRALGCCREPKRCCRLQSLIKKSQAQHYRGLSAILGRNGPGNMLFFILRGPLRELFPERESTATTMTNDLIYGDDCDPKPSSGKFNS
ncbi:hypothetical protein PsorP6_010516 [Peronosclerospora sorghi]|uniref:Uncharacterized protein n=1 Tax=Peronosclerospora sorghi TaxID=230839 RepID=A0ACC0VXN3_9STRA|nr:hypothetical protein PsorP6_010516 [Peronosclerospora sorghi]